MLKVTDIFQVGDSFSVTLNGESDNIINGCKLADNDGNIVVVKSVAMIRHSEPDYRDENIIVLVDKCNIAVGSILSMI